MDTFNKFLEQKLLKEDAPGMPPAGGISAPGSLGGPMGAGGAPPMGGMPPMGGGMGMGMPPMGGGMPGASSPGQAPQKLKAYNVWDVLERVLSGDGHEENQS